MHTYSPNYLGGWGGRITQAQKDEATVNQDRATVLQPGRQTKIRSQNKQQKRSCLIYPWDKGGSLLRATIWERESSFCLCAVTFICTGWVTACLYHRQCDFMKYSCCLLKMSQVWWRVLVVPTTWEAEVGGLIEPRSSSPAWATWQTPTYF